MYGNIVEHKVIASVNWNVGHLILGKWAANNYGNPALFTVTGFFSLWTGSLLVSRWSVVNVNQTGHAIKRNIEARSCNHCCSGKATIITYSECVFIAWGIQHALHMSGIVIRGVSGSYNIFTRYFINCTIF